MGYFRRIQAHEPPILKGRSSKPDKMTELSPLSPSSRLRRVLAVLFPIAPGFVSTALALVMAEPISRQDLPILGLLVLLSPGLGFHAFLVLSLVLAVLSGFGVSTTKLRYYSLGSTATLLILHVSLLMPVFLARHIGPLGWVFLVASWEPLLLRVISLPLGFLFAWYLSRLIPAIRAYKRGAPNPSLQRTRFARR